MILEVLIVLWLQLQTGMHKLYIKNEMCDDAKKVNKWKQIAHTNPEALGLLSATQMLCP